MDKYVYMSKKEIMKNIIEDMIENADDGYITRKDILHKFVENGLYSSYKSADRSCASSFSSVIKEIGLKTMQMGRGLSSRYYKELPKEVVETGNDAGEVEALAKAVLDLSENQKEIVTMLQELQAVMDRIIETLKENNDRKSKPKATPQKDTVERVKEFNFHVEVKNNICRLIGQDASKLSFEWYSLYINQMIGYISSKEKLTENQIKTFIYSEMSKEYGYNFGIEKKNFVSRLGRQPKSGIEIMYEKEDYRSVFYNKIADRLAKDYGL